ncbi:MAG: YgfZ/GcvT domain-containing protein [Hyphomicrobium sp.]
MNISLLKDRCCLRITGSDTFKFLQGLLTNDVSLLETQKSIYAGLLSPQGKVLFDFILIKDRDGVIFDVVKSSAVDLIRRLNLYKLRSDIHIEDLSDQYNVIAFFGEGDNLKLREEQTFTDPRLEMLGWRSLIEKTSNVTRIDFEDDSKYHAHRIRLGVPEGGKDYIFGETYPHEALFDLLHGLSFSKGCYIGQEIVSRMEHRAVIRKRIVVVIGESHLQQGASVSAAEIEIGRIGSVNGSLGLALLRVDWINEAQKKGVQLLSMGNPLKIEIPNWVRL